MRWDIAVRKTMGHPAHGFRLDVAFASDAERLVMVGPSGAGKSLTLRAIAGLLKPGAGRVAVGGDTLFDSAAGVDLPVQHRHIGYVFQEYALFPHLTVRQNVAFGLDAGWRNPRREVRSDKVDHLLDTFELDALGDRYPDQLSGGQRQRAALARALAAQPRALLLDEPFAALDSNLRSRLRVELVELQERLALPILLITHDTADVDAFADDVVQLAMGRVGSSVSAPASASS